ncbi:MAG: hypothetical protein Q9173_001718 [Seirophora scorigena]
MSSKSAKPTDEEILALFDEDEAKDETTVEDSKVAPQTSTSPDADPDLIPELLSQRQRPTSRPHTPRLPSSTTTQSSKASPRRTGINTPPSNDGARSSEEKAPPRKSGESSRSFHTSFTPVADDETELEHEKRTTTATPQAAQAQNSGSGWWGGIFATASAAVKQAESLAKEIQHNEEAQRWAEQVKGNVGALRGLGGELRLRALPTFTNILHTIAPPISSHERLQIHITHDIIGYPSLDPLIYNTFSRVMAQVEGGELMVVQRGQESSRRRGSDVGGFTGSGSSGWSDGPWWRQSTEARKLGAVKGLVEGTKLSKVSAESYAGDFYTARGGVEKAAQQATEVLNESNPVRSSDIFLSIQAIEHQANKEMFGEPPKETSNTGMVDPDEEPDDLIAFAIYLHDPIHGITFNTLTQTMPQKWVEWLDASVQPSEGSESKLPPEIAEIVESGGVDPREWAAEWIEETLSLGVGIVAQRYVARRMGVGLGGIGKGKARQQALESGGGALVLAGIYARCDVNLTSFIEGHLNFDSTAEIYQAIQKMRTSGIWDEPLWTISLPSGPRTTPKNPVVLAHGLLGFDELRLAGRVLPGIHYWRGIAEAMSKNGIEVITTHVPASSSIEERAAKLGSDIEAKAGGKSVNIIASAVRHLDGTEQHPCADSSVATYLPRIYEALGRLRIRTGAFRQLTRPYMNEDFNPNTPDREGVRYFSYGASVEPALYSAFRQSHRIVSGEEGANDGLVSVASSKWGDYKGTLVSVSHLDLINWTNRLRWIAWEMTGNKRNFNAIAFYLDIGDMLAKEGL